MALLASFVTTGANANEWALYGGHVDEYGSTEAYSIAIGTGAKAFIGLGGQEGVVSFEGRDCKSKFFGVCIKYTPKDNGKYLPEAIAIGTNAYARTGSIQIGSHNLGENLRIGDVDNIKTMSQLFVGNTSVGTNSFVNGAFATSYGAYNIQSSPYDGNNGALYNNAFSTVIGTFNSSEGMTEKQYVGVGNFIGGVANKVSMSNGAVVLGGGNTVKNSFQDLSNLASIASSSLGSPGEIQDNAIKQLQRAQGGSGLVLGSGNTLENTVLSQIFGVQNTIKGTSENTISKNISVSGIANTVDKSNNVVLFGNNRTISSSSDTIVLGFSNRKVTTSAQQAVVIGSEANVTKDGGVALGYKSIASTAKGIAGYDPETETASTKTDATWTSTAGAVSIGDTSNNITRQITGVAAGTADTDAVNVAQLKAALKKAMENQSSGGGPKNVTVSSGDSNINVKPTEQGDVTDYAVSLNKEKIEVGTDPTKEKVTIDGDNSTITAGTGDNQVVINGKDGTVTTGTGDKQVVLSGQDGTVTAGAGDNKVVIDGNKGNVTIGGAINLNGQNGNANFGDNIAFNGQTGGANFGSVTINKGGKGTVGGLTNTTWNPNNYVSGQAATEDQLYQATQAQNNQYRELKRDIADLDDDIRDAGAAAAALAGLKPIQYDPVQPTQLMAAIGGYRGSVALSLGIGHYTSERMLWHAGVAMNEHPMFNVGFTFKFGNRKLKDANDREYPIHDRYKAGPITASYVMQRDLSGDLDQHNGLIDDVNALKAKDAKVEALEAEVAQLREELKEFKELLKKGKVK